MIQPPKPVHPKQKYVPVVNMKQEPLMPTTPARAKKWIKNRKATPFWKKGIFCVRLNVPTQENKQEVVVAIDPGSKKEGFSVMATAHTYFNIQPDAVDGDNIKEKVEKRRNARRARRYRNTPCRQPRWNRKGRGMPPSTKARWQWKLNVCNWLKKIIPITVSIVEDVAAVTKPGQKRWNVSFSPLEVGKKWFYKQLGPNLQTKKGYETAELRTKLGLVKISDKLSDSFNAHCVDSWALGLRTVIKKSIEI